MVVEGVINTGTAENPNYVENTNRINAQQYWGAYSGVASNYVKEQTNIRLREVSLSYSLPSSIMAKTPLTNATISLVGRNLFFIYSKIDNYDPASSYSSNQYAQGVMYFNLPTTTQFGFSIDLQF